MLFLTPIFVIPAMLIEETLIDLFEIIPKYFPWEVIVILYILNVIEKLEFSLSFEKANATMA